jgi:hypothetical protein
VSVHYSCGDRDPEVVLIIPQSTGR